MKKIDLYKKTVDILYDAYFKGTLQHGDSCACAVGNMVAANMGYEFTSADTWSNGAFPEWSNVFCSSSEGQSTWQQEYAGEAKIQIDSTGYSWLELARIEKAFESTANFNYSEIEESMFNGLVAVLEVLKDIHEITDEELLYENNQKFEKHYQSRKELVK